MEQEDIIYNIKGYTVYNTAVNSSLDFSDITNTRNLMCLCKMIYEECSDMLLLCGKNISIVASKRHNVCTIIISYSDTYHEKEKNLTCVKTAPHELTIKETIYSKTTKKYTNVILGVKAI